MSYLSELLGASADLVAALEAALVNDALDLPLNREQVTEALANYREARDAT